MRGNFQVAKGARLRGATRFTGVDMNPEKHEIGELMFSRSNGRHGFYDFYADVFDF